MKTRYCKALCVAVAALFAHSAMADTTLRVYVGGANRPDLMRKMFDQFERKTPGVKVVIESGGSTSELQRAYLSTVLSAHDSSLDVMMIDIVNPAQYMHAQWIEPLDKYLGSDATNIMKSYMPAYAKASVVDGKITSLPAYADAQFMYYRKDLLAKYHLPEPKTWDQLASEAKTVLAGERDTSLQGLSIQGAPIEGAVCTFLTPYWSQGKELIDASGRLALDKPAAEKGMNMWLNLVDQGVIKKNVAEVKTQDTTTDFRSGKAVFAVSWGMVWGHFQEPDSAVKDKVGIMPIPAMAGGSSDTCAGGWQWAVSAYSTQKKDAVALVRWMATPEVSKFLAINAAMMPANPGVFQDAAVLKSAPWFSSAKPVLESARARPVSDRYGEISDTVRTATSAMLGRAVTVPDGIDAMSARLRRVMR
ncbi:ABC transporter substrate-binding protein [Paraburkholderia aromaticivorans]|uniref:ABC transporter substrate-binding protein n=1 Tax=Paraburkholderia aromaticivorans TaxID=2026199 RepID=UPI00197E2230|nr:ABC transporter substrate-binding protein [Paraburkholderia aromaticivorans]